MGGAYTGLGGMRPDTSDDDVRPSEDGLVRKAKDDETLGPQPVVPDLVFRLSQRMNPAIRFDDELDGWAAEVSDIGTERHLASESQTIDPTVADVNPQRLLGPRRLLASTTSRRPYPIAVNSHELHRNRTDRGTHPPSVRLRRPPSPAGGEGTVVVVIPA